MTSSSRRKGDDAEREIKGILRTLSGWEVERAYGAGRPDDHGDLVGLPHCCAQVKSYTDPARGLRELLPDLHDQWRASGETFAVGFLRRRGGQWVAVMSPEMFCTLLREATDGQL